MQIGDKILSDLYLEFGEGTIISKREIFSEEYFKIFFEDAGKTVEIKGDDIKPIESPLNLLSNSKFSPTLDFKLNYLAHSLKALASEEKALSPVNFKIKPLPHQLLALNFVIDQFRPRCLLADEVGLGKTIEAALVMEELKLRNIVKRVLIIAPAGLTQQWKDELQLKFSEDFSIFDGNSFKSFKQLYGLETNVWSKFDNVITSIDFLKPRKSHSDLSEREKKRRDEHNQFVFDDCVNAGWDMVIIDEAHKLAKSDGTEETARYKLGKALSDSVPIFLILTATPHQGKPDVFKNLLRLVDPYTFNRIEDLKPKNVKKITVKNRKRASIDFNGEKLFKERITTLRKIKWEKSVDDPEKELYQEVVKYVSEYYDYARQENNNILIFLLMLYQRIVSSSSKAVLKSLERRLATIKSLTKQAKMIMEYSLDDFFDVPGEQQLYDLEKIVPILNNPHLVKKEVSIITRCIELAKNAVIGRNDAKMRELIQIIDELKRTENDKNLKLLIFTEFIETQKYIIESLERIGYKTAHINGKLSLQEKIEQKTKFKESAQIMVSTDAGGEGINLQFCHVVVNYDLPWNPMKIEQRIGRVDRIGQDKDVIVVNFVLSDTIEEYVRDTIEGKLEIVKKQFGEDKLHDILTTLDEEFSFDKLYIDYIVKNKVNDEELQEISDLMFQKATDVLEKDDILIPFSEDENLKSFDVEDIRRISNKIKRFISLFLEKRGLELKEYRDKDGLFYFKNDFKTDIFSKHFSKVIFEQHKALDEEDADLLSFKHPFLNESLLAAKNIGKTSSFKIENNNFGGTQGFLFNFLFTISNNFNINEEHVLTIFIDDDLRFNRRISNYLSDMADFKLSDAKNNVKIDLNEYYYKAERQANEVAENIFWEFELNIKSKIEEDLEKIRQYYRQKEHAIQEIKIDNIRQGRMKELKKERSERMLELKKESELFPEIECFQAARVLFKS